MSQPFNITLSVPSGNPDKLRLIEKTNRLSLGLVFNRDELPEVASARKELDYTGVYLLVNNANGGLPELYIGEGESVITRLRSHSKDTKKDFWEWVVVFVNRDNSLHKGHIQYVEASLVERAQQTKRCIIKNDVSPNKPSLPEAVIFEAEELLNDIYQIVPLLGISAFEQVSDTDTVESRSEP
ncbi:GIY-YIG nuclease family protein, partial [Pseudomonadota bacterium]